MREVNRPYGSGAGNGKAVYFFYGLKDDNETDVRMRDEDLASISDDVNTCLAHGFATVVDTHANRRSLRAALYNQDPDLEGYETVAIYWSGHGAEDGSIQIYNGQWIEPDHINPSYVTPGLRWMVFSSCHTGKHRGIWAQRIGQQVKIIAWNRVLWQSEAIDFNTPDGKPGWELDDLIREMLLDGGGGADAVPEPPENWVNDEFDPGDMEYVDDPDEDAYWDDLMSGIKSSVADYIEEQTGIDDAEPIIDLVGAAAGFLGELLLGDDDEEGESTDDPGRSAESEWQPPSWSSSSSDSSGSSGGDDWQPPPAPWDS